MKFLRILSYILSFFGQKDTIQTILLYKKQMEGETLLYVPKTG